MEEHNWDTLLLEVDLPDSGDILDNESEQVTEPPSQPCLTHNPDEELVVSLWIGEIEKVLMEDDNFDHRVETQLVPNDDFLADLLDDSPPCSSNGMTHTDVDKDDPIVKKQRRQMRNRDATVRSRERKKMYVKDLEMKSRYLEEECRRLSRVLQCFIVENQALQIFFSFSP
ncbi:bZIP transcription factor 60-like protein [Gossypium australe]|uniref:BZIP transcription factor 60-like protein n=1 Tax=Gossypium australe TaxID=47621 RepID=A0A5B6V3J9_9ROSI|nr:bZIP transcription factor 60-like protein [Gossypium australe]